MACNCGSGGLQVDEVRKVIFPDGEWVLAETESQARGEITAHGGGTWITLRGSEASDARAAFAARLLAAS